VLYSWKGEGGTRVNSGPGCLLLNQIAGGDVPFYDSTALLPVKQQGSPYYADLQPRTLWDSKDKHIADVCCTSNFFRESLRQRLRNAKLINVLVRLSQVSLAIFLFAELTVDSFSTILRL
jgi:hypothetical protein